MIFLFWFEFSTVIWHFKQFFDIFECRSFIERTCPSTYIIKDCNGDDISCSGALENLSVLREFIFDLEAAFFG